MSRSPRVTVLMSVHNGEPYLRQALESILNQSWSDFELLVIDDCSTDNSRAIITACSDARLQLVVNQENLGLSASLARGMEMARGEYLARMDADDISLPRRLERQVTFMERHPQVGVCGSWIRYMGTSDKLIRYPEDSNAIAASLLFNPALAHPATMLRRELFTRHGLNYDPGCRRAQDYDLWYRAFPLMGFANLPEVLLHYRLHPQQARQSAQEQQQDTADRVRRSLLHRLSINPTPEEWEIHRALATCRIQGLEAPFRRIDQWLTRLATANCTVRLFDPPALGRVLAHQWLVLGKKSQEAGKWSPAMLRHASFLKACGVGWSGVLADLLHQAGVLHG